MREATGDKPMFVAVTQYLHRHIFDHKDPESGLSKDCLSCQKIARGVITTVVADVMLEKVLRMSGEADMVLLAETGVTH